MYSDVFTIIVPDLHPLAGHTIDVPAESGATDSGWVRVRFTTPIREAVRELRAAVQSVRKADNGEGSTP